MPANRKNSSSVRRSLLRVLPRNLVISITAPRQNSSSLVPRQRNPDAHAAQGVANRLVADRRLRDVAYRVAHLEILCDPVANGRHAVDILREIRFTAADFRQLAEQAGSAVGVSFVINTDRVDGRLA